MHQQSRGSWPKEKRCYGASAHMHSHRVSVQTMRKLFLTALRENCIKLKYFARNFGELAFCEAFCRTAPGVASRSAKATRIVALPGSHIQAVRIAIAGNHLRIPWGEAGKLIRLLAIHGALGIIHTGPPTFRDLCVHEKSIRMLVAAIYCCQRCKLRFKS